MAIDVVLKWLTEGAQKAAEEAGKISEEIEKTGEKAEETGKKFDEAGDKVEDTGNKVEKLGDKTSKAKSEAEKLTDAFKNVRKAGLAIAAVGGGMSVLAHRMTEARIEADKLQGMLNAKLSSAGLTQASGQIQEMAQELAKLNGEDPLRLADKIATVVSTGRGFRSLAKSGIVISTEERSAIRAADPEEQWELIQKAAARSMKELEGTLTDLQKATYAQQVRWGELQETMGEGSSVVRVALYNNVLSPLYSILETNEGLTKTAGAITSIGGAALAAGGGLIATVAQLAMIAQGFPALAATGTATFAAISGAIGPAIAGLVGMVAPIIALVAPFLLVAAAAAAAFYAIDRLSHWNEDKALKANIAKGDEAEKKLLDLTNKKRAEKGLPPKTMEEFQSGKEPAASAVQTARGTTPAVVPPTTQIPQMPMVSTPVTSFTPPSISDAQMIRAAEKAEAERLGLGASQVQNKVTLRPETRASQNSRGNWVVEILPKSFEIPNTFGRAVEAL